MKQGTFRFELLPFREKLEQHIAADQGFPNPYQFFQPNGKPLNALWSVFREGEIVVLKNRSFKVGHIGESHLLLEPQGVVEIGAERDED